MKSSGVGVVWSQSLGNPKSPGVVQGLPESESPGVGNVRSRPETPEVEVIRSHRSRPKSLGVEIIWSHPDSYELGIARNRLESSGVILSRNRPGGASASDFTIVGIGLTIAEVGSGRFSEHTTKSQPEEQHGSWARMAALRSRTGRVHQGKAQVGECAHSAT